MSSLQEIEEKLIEEFRAEYIKAYENIFGRNVLEEGNPWFENFIRQSLAQYREAVLKEIEGLRFDLTPIEESIAAGMSPGEAYQVYSEGKSYLVALDDLATLLRGHSQEKGEKECCDECWAPGKKGVYCAAQGNCPCHLTA